MTTLHVGLPKTGTTWLQASLRRHGLLPDADATFLGALDVREHHDGWGRTGEETRGAWKRLTQEHPDLISHELLAAADAERVRWALRRLDDVHVVVTARDPARQAVAEWQEGVKHGRRLSFARFATAVLPETAGSSHARKFRAAQDLPAVLERWGRDLPAERVHVVTCPPRGADRTVLWRRFAEACGVDPTLEPAGAEEGNASLGVDEIALLRRVNKALDGRLQEPAYGRLVKRLYAQRLLGEPASPAPDLPEPLYDDLTVRAERWAKQIHAAGWQVHGAVDDLLPRRPATATDPDALDAVRALRTSARATAGLLLEVAGRDAEIASLRDEVARLTRKRDKLRRRLKRAVGPR
ncbi:hypothetical protein D9V37_08665 [Nocardioides mangrovicus]|uniref:Sulfotransferase family protein n=1 Tax=Nocardioides mangrovicus TaxID=2478913 RepID=A0A3L8P671_9ACTN|nr:hypothetical protein [Nocardioides mangrovicus]RLV49938.1 hypothetical protein D9V37_08665 [Nocardioides mangrovicus]